MNSFRAVSSILAHIIHVVKTEEHKKEAVLAEGEVEVTDEPEEPTEHISDLSREAYQIIAEGGCITTEMAIRLVKEKIDSPACAFRGETITAAV